MAYAWLILTFLLAAGLSYQLSKQKYLLDHPNHRSMHTDAIPRSGGLAILIAIIFSIIALSLNSNTASQLTWLSLALLALLPLAYLDDHNHVPAHYRLLSQFITALILTYGYAPQAIDLLFLSLNHPYNVAIILILFVIWIINLYNFMDGIDGIAAGMTVIGCLCLAIMGVQAHAYLYTQTALIAATASAGFLIVNLSPARIFMGDLGSTLLGALIATLILWGCKIAVLSFSTGLLIFSPFIVDTTLTLSYRILRREKIWEAHSSHYYQRLTRKIGQRKTLLWEYALMIGCALSALFINHTSLIQQTIILLTAIGLYGILIFKLEHFLKPG